MSVSVSIVNDIIQVALANIGPQGGQGDTGPQGPPNLAPLLAGDIFITSASNAFIILRSYAVYPFTVDAINNLQVSAGTITLTMQKNGVPIPGLSGLIVTTTPQFPVATSGNSFGIGDQLSVLLSGGTLASNLQGTWQGTPL